MDKLNSELRDVHSIMTKNINELLERGDRLERMLGVREEPPVDSRRGVWVGAGVRRHDTVKVDPGVVEAWRWGWSCSCGACVVQWGGMRLGGRTLRRATSGRLD